MNWSDVISELSKLGYTQARIAEKCNCGQVTVSDLSCGKTTDPKYSTAQALLTLLQKARKEAKRKAPARVQVSEQNTAAV